MTSDDEGRALDLLWRTLYAADGKSAFCRGCGTIRVFHRVTGRRAYACDHCGGQIYPAAATPFGRSPIPLCHWLTVLGLMLGSSGRPTTGHLAQRLGISDRRAWRMRQRLERSMSGDVKTQKLLRRLASSWSGIVSEEAIERGSPDERICEAACRVMAEKGLADTRVADIATLAGISSASVHYHFRSKDEVLLAAFRWACDQSNQALQGLVDDELEPVEHVRRLAELCVPAGGTARDEYVLWLELWSRVRNHPDFLQESLHMSRIWYEGVRRILQGGVDGGAFVPVAPLDEVCRRFLALAESLSYRATVGYREMPSKQAQQMLVRFAGEQLGIASLSAR